MPNFVAIVKVCGMVVAAGATTELVYQLYSFIRRKYVQNNGNTQTESRNEVCEVLFFPDEQIACKDHFTSDYGCENTRCRFTHSPNSLSRLYKYISEAKTSLDVCVFVICCSDLGDLLVLAHQRGVKVRVICDDEQVDFTGSQIWKLREQGISVRTDRSSYLMHHKFVVIDRKLLISGSFNWTRQAISGNQENLMILSNTSIVDQFMMEYNRLWEQFDPNHT